MNGANSIVLALINVALSMHITDLLDLPVGLWYDELRILLTDLRSVRYLH